jgi:hypothetical protein
MPQMGRVVGKLFFAAGTRFSRLAESGFRRVRLSGEYCCDD